MSLVNGIEKFPIASSTHGFFRYTFKPTFSSRSVTDTFPSVVAMMMVLPDPEGPNSLLRSTLIVRMFPSTFISTFFKQSSFDPSGLEQDRLLLPISEQRDH